MPNSLIRVVMSLAVIGAASLSSTPAIAAYELEFPEAPAGFEWMKIEEIKAAFLVPDGWYFKAEERDGTLGYFITKENIDEVGRFDTGLSINVIRQLKDRDAVDFAREFSAAVAAQNELIRDWTTDVGAFKGFGCLTKNAVEGEDAFITMHTLAIGNEKTNTLYIIFFESLEEEWDQAWKVGKQMLRLFMIDDDI
jgi:hypothetical protein